MRQKFPQRDTTYCVERNVRYLVTVVLQPIIMSAEIPCTSSRNAPLQSGGTIYPNEYGSTTISSHLATLRGLFRPFFSPLWNQGRDEPPVVGRSIARGPETNKLSWQRSATEGTGWRRQAAAAATRKLQAYRVMTLPPTQI